MPSYLNEQPKKPRKERKRAPKEAPREEARREDKEEDRGYTPIIEYIEAKGADNDVIALTEAILLSTIEDVARIESMVNHADIYQLNGLVATKLKVHKALLETIGVKVARR